jgi:hypothetical protein
VPARSGVSRMAGARARLSAELGRFHLCRVWQAASTASKSRRQTWSIPLCLPNHPTARPGTTWSDFLEEKRHTNEAASLCCSIAASSREDASRTDRTQIRVVDDHRRCSVKCRAERLSMRVVRSQPPGRPGNAIMGMSPCEDRADPTSLFTSAVGNSTLMALPRAT